MKLTISGANLNADILSEALLLPLPILDFALASGRRTIIHTWIFCDAFAAPCRTHQRCSLSDSAFHTTLAKLWGKPRRFARCVFSLENTVPLCHQQYGSIDQRFQFVSGAKPTPSNRYLSKLKLFSAKVRVFCGIFGPGVFPVARLPTMRPKNTICGTFVRTSLDASRNTTQGSDEPHGS